MYGRKKYTAKASATSGDRHRERNFKINGHGGDRATAEHRYGVAARIRIERSASKQA